MTCRSVPVAGGLDFCCYGNSNKHMVYVVEQSQFEQSLLGLVLIKRAVEWLWMKETTLTVGFTWEMYTGLPHETQLKSL